MPIKSLNTIFRGGAKPDDSGPSYKRYSKDTSKRGSFQIAQPVTAPLTPPLSPFYPGFPGRSDDPPAQHVSHSPCVTISGPLPDDVFAMIVSQQQQPQIMKQHRHSYSLGSSRATLTDQPQLCSILPSRSSSLAPSLASLTSSSTSPSVSGPATPTSDAPNPLAGRGIDKFHRQGSCATLTHNGADAQNDPSLRPRNVRAGSSESMTHRGVSWGTKRSVSDRTLCLEKRDEEMADETRSLLGKSTEAFAAQSRAPKHPEFRLSGIPLRSTPNPITMSRSLSTGTFIRISPLSSPHGPSTFQSLRPPPAATSTNKQSARPAALSLSPSKDRNQVRNLGSERSLLSPPLSAVGRSPGRRHRDHDIPSSWTSGSRGNTGEPSSGRSRVPVAPPKPATESGEMGGNSNNNVREEFRRRTSSGSDEPTSPNRTHNRDSRRCTFGGGPSLVTPVNNTTTMTTTTASPRLSKTVVVVSPRVSIQHPLTPPPDIPLPPVPTTTRPPRPMSSMIPTPGPSSLSISRTTSGARPALTSRHSAASRLPTLKYRKSSSELDVREGSSGQQSMGGGRGRRPPTPWAEEEKLGHQHQHHHQRSPELAQFGEMDYLSSAPALLTEEPSLFPCPSTAGAPPRMMPLSPSFDALGAMLDSPRDEGRDSLLLDMEPPWLDSPALPSSQSPQIPASAQEVEGQYHLTTRARGEAGTIREQGRRARTDYLPSRPPTSTEMQRTRSSGLEGIKLLIAQVDDWSRVNGHQQANVGGGGSMLEVQDPFNARAMGGVGVTCRGMGMGETGAGEGQDGPVVWGCAF